MRSNKTGKAGYRTEYCVGGPTFRPSQSLKDRDRHDAVIQALRETNDLKRAIETWFCLEDGDKYAYHASTSVKLSQVQRIIEKGGEGGLHAWYWLEKKGERHPVRDTSFLFAPFSFSSFLLVISVNTLFFPS